jgi:hypothetical protein
MPTTTVFRLVGMHTDEDSKELFKRLVQQADTGELVGSIVISFCRKKKGGKFYTLSTSGWIASNPTLATGAMSACQVLLQELALKEAGLL